MTEELNIRRGVSEDIPELVRLYDETVGHLESHVNYPGWKKGVYPGRDAAEEGVETGTLYVAETGGRIIGSIILNGKQEAAYNGVSWGVEAEPDEVMVIHTFLVHPNFRKSGAGKFLMEFAELQALREGKKTIRLDVYEKNEPAVRLYERQGYRYVATVDLGLGSWGLPWFKLYERTAEECLNGVLSRISPLSAGAAELASLTWSHVAKPLYSLGILEEDVIKIAGISETQHVDIGKRALIIMCSDNGIVEEGVTQTGQEVTAVVTENMTDGNSSVCLMADRAGVDVFPVDIGVSRDLRSGARNPLIRKKLAYGTKNFHKEPAMTRETAVSAIAAGISVAGELKEKGYRLIATGEMGIGNTTTSSAVAAMLLDRDPTEMTGRGAGLSDEGLMKKISVIREAVKRYGPECRDAIDVIAHVGGLDLAGLTGVFLGGAVYRIPVLIDGFISGTAALAAAKLAPAARDYMLATHVSAEPAGRLLLDELGLKPFVAAGMCLGEGTGAVASIPLLDMALEVYTKMSTFQDIQIEEYKPLAPQTNSGAH